MNGRSAPLEDLYHGGHVFLLLGGPSLRNLDLAKLHQPGMVTFGINNVAAYFRTHLWTFGDKPAKFHDAIWSDPGILKFVPVPKLGKGRNNGIRRKTASGFKDTGKFPRDYPGVFGLRRNSEFNFERWLWEDTINWGHSKKHGGQYPFRLNTMFQAVRLCYFLGFRTVYLLGADFNMTEEDGYAFPENRHEGAVRGNMNAYADLNWYFRRLRPWFENALFEVFNCNEASRLLAFDHMSFNDATQRARAKAGISESIDTRGWYADFSDNMETE